MSSKITIFDTTLRDGEQALQSSLNLKEKIQIALALERMGVDIIEVGFPISSPGDFESVKIIASKIKDSKVCALARCIEKDIYTAYQALKIANNFRIHIFLATSPIHIITKLRSTLPNIIERIIYMINICKKYTNDIEFSCEDGGRTPIDDLCRVVESAIKAGATTINIPDTVGYTLPHEYGKIIQKLISKVPNIDKVILSIHTHNDLGMAVGNAIEAIKSGARQIEGTINGLGERAGNCALEEVLMAIKTRKDILNMHTNIKHKEIYRTSQIVSQVCNIPVPSNKAIIGTNAFSHSSGIHQDGILKNRENYEIITPESIGLNKIQFNLTSRSGRSALKHRMHEMGYKENSDYNLDTLYSAFLKLADKKGRIFDYDLEALVFFNNQLEENEYFILENFNVYSGSNISAIAFVTLKCGLQSYSKNAQGNGPVDAVYKAIIKITNFKIDLINYHLNAKGQGKDALGQVNIVINYKGRKFHGTGLDTDIIESSIQAMTNALNNIWRAQEIQKKIKSKAHKVK